jgi:hypothetical protein
MNVDCPSPALDGAGLAAAIVRLKGHVHTWQERDDAARAAPGVVTVENRLAIR